MERIPASPVLSKVAASSIRRPTRCPYCPNNPTPHWICWGTYERYGEAEERIRNQRYHCKVKVRTFSILPDALLPYHHPTAGAILSWLKGIHLEGRGAATVARMFGASRSTVRRIRSKFERMLGVLRLPGTEGALGPAEFLTRLDHLGVAGVVDLFAAWKELEPKLSIVGAYPR